MPGFVAGELSCRPDCGGFVTLGCTRRNNWNRPHIVWLIGDDLSPDFSSYGVSGVQTPHIDQLASEGARFTRAYSTSPVCSPSRSAWIMGMYQTSTGSHQHRTPVPSQPPLPSGVHSILKYFRDAGYYLANKGKQDYNLRLPTHYDGNDWRKAAPGQPFFYQMQIGAPHRDNRGKNKDPSRLMQLRLPSYYPDHALTRKDWADYLAEVEAMDRTVGRVVDELKRARVYDNTIIFVTGDHGRPMVRAKQWLYESGIRVPMIVRDPRGRLTPGSVDDRMLSLIDMSVSSLAAAGAFQHARLQGRDIFHAGFHGREALFAARDRCDGTADRIRSVRVGNWKLIRNFRPHTPYMLGDQENAYKHRQYPVHTLLKVMHQKGMLSPEQALFLTASRPEYELFDLDADPDEVRNLADDPLQRPVLHALQQRLEAWMRETGDMGAKPDPDAAALLRVQQDKIRKQLAATGSATDMDYLSWWARQYNVPVGF